jgi:hypothetical protein
MSRLVMGQELRAAIAELTRDAPRVRRSELYERYFRNADWEKFRKRLWRLSAEGLATTRPDPQHPGDRLVEPTREGREIRVRPRALLRGRRRRGERAAR